ncbi:hypothetical protein PO124_13045 [Bacillus licheniformis]|nr:hypothetical protein [Bacillus licheniformis]
MDADQDLSVQVHPNDEYAKLHETGSLERRNAGISLIARKMRRSFTATMPRRGKNWSQ